MLTGYRLLILVLLISFASVSGVLFTPSLPTLATYFNVPESDGQFAMTIFLIGYSLGQLPYGPLANRFGRKKAIFIGVFLALIGSLICLFSTEFSLFCAGRFIQALGAAVGLKVSYTMMGDHHKGKSATKMLSYVMISFAVMPGIGTAIGGFLTVYFGWQGCFAFLSIYSVLIGLLCTLLPETAPELDKTALQFQKIRHNFGKQFKDPFLVYHALLMSTGTALIYIFATVAPYIGIEQMGLSPDQYGLWNLIPACGMVIGLMSSAHFSSRLPPRIAMLSGILLALLGVTLMGGLFTKGFNVPAALFIPGLFILLGDSVFYGSASGKAISEAKDKSNASAVMQFINMSVATVLVLLTGMALPFHPIILAGIFACIVACSLALWLKLKAHH